MISKLITQIGLQATPASLNDSLECVARESVEPKLRLPLRERFSIIDMQMWTINLIRAHISMPTTIPWYGRRHRNVHVSALYSTFLIPAMKSGGHSACVRRFHDAFNTIVNFFQKINETKTAEHNYNTSNLR